MDNTKEVITHIKTNIAFNKDDIYGTRGKLINLIDEYSNTNKVGYLYDAKELIDDIIEYEAQNKALKSVLVQLEG